MHNAVQHGGDVVRPSLIIFDCDGVLVDSEPVANHVFTDAVGELGLEMTYAEVCREFIGFSMSQCVQLIERRMGRPLPRDFVEEVQRRTFDEFRRGLESIPGVAEALARIDIPVCVASSGELEKMRLTLGITGLLPRFEGRLFSAEQVTHGKPAPDLFLFAARRMDVPPWDCAVVEDSRPGVLAARAAGMRALGYATGTEADRLRDAGAEVFGDMAELPHLFDRERTESRASRKEPVS
jgi:HAD superfamily hydrolase (TIGR01509 family)